MNKELYVLDKIGRIQEVLDGGSLVAKYSYNTDSTIKMLSYSNGVQVSYEYDGDMNITKLTTLLKDGSVLAQNGYVYDNNGNQVQKTEGGKVTEYVYDSISQIQKVVYSKTTADEKTEIFAYDNAGNRIKRVIDNAEEKYYYDNKNRLTKLQGTNKGTVTYSYDHQGNTLKEQSVNGSTEYEYDVYNRAVGVKTADGHIQKNIYDAIGLRAAVENDDKTSQFIFNGWNVVGELDEEGRIKAREVRGYGLLEKSVENKVYFYLHNEHGDVTRLVDQAEKTVNSYEYDVFGNTVDKKEGIKNSFRYAGEQYDGATGQYYLRARFYNPTLGRFTQEDIYRSDGLNLYVYVKNNPIKWVDPSGYGRKPIDFSTMPQSSWPTKAQVTNEITGSPNIPTNANGFDNWFDNLTTDQLTKLYQNQDVKNVIKANLRGEGGMHEWHMVSQADVFKSFGLTAADIKNQSSPTSDVKFKDIFAGDQANLIQGTHGTNSASSIAHSELEAMISSSKNEAEFVSKLQKWANQHVEGGADSLPGFLKNGSELPDHLKTSTDELNNNKSC